MKHTVEKKRRKKKKRNSRRREKSSRRRWKVAEEAEKAEKAEKPEEAEADMKNKEKEETKEKRRRRRKGHNEEEKKEKEENEERGKRWGGTKRRIGWCVQERPGAGQDWSGCSFKKTKHKKTIQREMLNKKKTLNLYTRWFHFTYFTHTHAHTPGKQTSKPEAEDGLDRVALGPSAPKTNTT